MSERLKKLHNRAMAIPSGLVVNGGRLPGGIAGVSVYSGHHRNTLLNWFSGRTNPTPEALADLKSVIETLEAKAQLKAAKEKAYLDEVLA